MNAIALPVRQGTPEWLEARYNGIGSSEAAAAVDADPNLTAEELVAEKLRLIPPIAETPDMRLGKLLEPTIARLYQEQTGNRVRRVNALLQHERHPFVLASLDRETYGQRRIVELKKRRFPREYGEPGSDEVPEPVLHQVQQQMAVTNYPVADVAVWDGSSPEILVYHVPADRDLQEMLIDAEADLWGYVERRELPPPTARPERAVVRPAGDLEANEELTALAERLAELRQRIRIDEEEVREVTDNLLAGVGGHRRLIGSDFSITVVAGGERKNVAWQKAAEAYRALAVELWAALEMHPGQRPFPIALAEQRPLESLFTTTSEVAPALRCYGRLFKHEEE